MAVYVWETGVIIDVALTGTATVEVNNRTTSAQNGRAILWDMSTSPKTSVDEETFQTAANTSITISLTTGEDTLTEWAIEVRFPDPHMNVTSDDNVPDRFRSPGNWFQDSDPGTNP